MPWWTRDGGNPQLKPWEANAYDVSYEKYFGGSKGYVSAAYFFKDLKTYAYRQATLFNIKRYDAVARRLSSQSAAECTGCVHASGQWRGHQVEGDRWGPV